MEDKIENNIMNEKDAEIEEIMPKLKRKPKRASASALRKKTYKPKRKTNEDDWCLFDKNKKVIFHSPDLGKVLDEGEKYPLYEVTVGKVEKSGIIIY